MPIMMPPASLGRRSGESNSSQAGSSTPKSITSVPAPTTRMVGDKLPTALEAFRKAAAGVPPQATAATGKICSLLSSVSARGHT